jgi:2-polyprenyl-3-methyl-5-hydroxy-6-metoxy-1,4-benzoquinol methylase
MSGNPSSAAIAKNALEFWDANAPIWDDVMRDNGNDYWTVLEMPALQRMAEVKPGDSALDLATGNGLVARWLAENGASEVSATDGSSAMLLHATKRTSDWATARGPQPENRITFKTLNVVDRDQVNLFVQEVSGYKVGFLATT